MKSLARAIIVSFLFFSSTAVGQNVSPPTGWRLPSRAERADDRGAHPRGRSFNARADFNDDGRRDEAWILLPTAGASAAGLFVFLRQPDRTYRSVQLDYVEGVKIENLYINLPGRNESRRVATDGCGIFRKGDRINLDFASRGLAFGTLESSELIYYWDRGSRTFQKVATGD